MTRDEIDLKQSDDMELLVENTRPSVGSDMRRVNARIANETANRWVDVNANLTLARATATRCAFQEGQLW
jgi:hypothetical protein